MENTISNIREESDNESESNPSDSDESNEATPECIVGLFCKDGKETFTSAEAVFANARQQYNFDFQSFQKRHNLNYYGSIQLINFIRSKIANGISPKMVIQLLTVTQHITNNHSSSPPLPFQREKYLKPTLDNDALLYLLDDASDDDDTSDDNDDDKNVSPPNIDEQKVSQTESDPQSNDESVRLRNQNEAMLREMNAMRQQMQSMKETFHSVILKDSETENTSLKKSRRDLIQIYDKHYFASYSRIGIHEEMLRDRTRTEAYQNFIENNRAIFDDKIVLDVGCGTGILSMFAARAGAKHVIGVDMADIVTRARLAVKKNNFDSKITIIKGKLEEIKQLKMQSSDEKSDAPNDDSSVAENRGIDVESVDVIISEWMGYFLVYESMLSSVIYARDRWLTENINKTPTIFPNRTAMYCAGLNYDAMKLAFWKDDCYDVDMSPMYHRPVPISDPLLVEVDPAFILTDYTCFQSYDMMTVKEKDLDLKCSFDISVTTSKETAIIDALVVYFDCFFESSFVESESDTVNDSDNNYGRVVLSTAPESTVTHWYHTVFLLPERLPVTRGESLRVELYANRCEQNPREYSVYVTVKKQGTTHEIRQIYQMNSVC